MKWVSVKTRKPKLGQRVLGWYEMLRYDKSIASDYVVVRYLIDKDDRRKRIFADKQGEWKFASYFLYDDSGLYGTWGWPVTYWMELPKEPNKITLRLNMKKENKLR